MFCKSNDTSDNVCDAVQSSLENLSGLLVS